MGGTEIKKISRDLAQVEGIGKETENDDCGKNHSETSKWEH